MSESPLVVQTGKRGSGRTFEMIRSVIECDEPGVRFVIVRTRGHVAIVLAQLGRYVNRHPDDHPDRIHIHAVPIIPDGFQLTYPTGRVETIEIWPLDRCEITRGRNGPRFIDHDAADQIVYEWASRHAGAAGTLQVANPETTLGAAVKTRHSGESQPGESES